MGFTEQEHSSDSMKAIEKLFTPEFRNRLDSVVQFKSLTEETIIHVVDKFIFQLEAQLHDKNVTLSLEPEARTWLANNELFKNILRSHWLMNCCLDS